MGDAATSLSCQLTMLIASGRWMAPSDHLRQPRENGCLQNVKQSVRHAKSSEALILKLKVKPSSHRICSRQRSWAPHCGFPALGPTASSHQKPRGCSRFPHQLQSTRARRRARTQSWPACPSLLPRQRQPAEATAAETTARRDAPRASRLGKAGSLRTHQSSPTALFSPPLAPPAQHRGGNMPHSAVSTRDPPKSQGLC